VGPLTDFFTSVIDGSKSAKEAFRDFVRAMIQNIIKLIAQMIALRAISAATGVPVAVLAGGQAQAGAFNSGGLIPGGGPNRDTVTAAVTPGEYVIQRPMVKRYGPAFFEALNRGRVPASLASAYRSGVSGANTRARYNTGGPVGTSSRRPRPRDVLPIMPATDANVDQMLSGGEGGFMRFISRNRTSVRAVLEGDQGGR
jgi:hypothetical protein